MKKRWTLALGTAVLASAYLGAKSFTKISAPSHSAGVDTTHDPRPASNAAPPPQQVASATPMRPRSSAAATEPAAKSRDVDRYLATTWLDTALHYHEPDRGKVLDDLLDSLVRRGPAVVAMLAGELSQLAADRGTERAAVFHALGRVGAAIASSGGSEASEALSTIHRVAQAELDLPPYIAPDPDLDVEHVSAAQRHALLHQTNLVEQDGKLVLPTTFNKASAIQMLTNIATPDALEQLEAMRGRDNPHVLDLAINHAIQSIRTKNRGESP